MKSAVILCILGVVAVCLARPKAGQYTDKYDGVNVDEILTNKRLLGPYIKCVMEQGNCTPEGKELRSHIKDALETDCSKCTEKQREGAEKVFRYLIDNEPESWNQLKAKYDPSGKYYKKHEAELRPKKG